MKKQILTLMVAAISITGFAQVGVGTADPKTTLHVVGTNDNGAVTGVDGVLVPRVNDADMSAANAGTEDGQLVYNTVDKSFYHWNDTAWTAVGGASAPAADFTVGSGGVLDVDVTSVSDFSANTTNNVLNVTASGGGPGSTTITLPTPANNAGRIMLIKNGGAKQIQVVNAFSTGYVPGSTGAIFICDGVEWVYKG